MARKPLGYIECYTDRVEWHDRLLDASRDKENKFFDMSLERKLASTLALSPLYVDWRLVSKKGREHDHHSMPIKFAAMPSCDRLNELLKYNPETGELKWRVSRSNMRAGDAASYIRTKKNSRQDHIIKIDGKMFYSSRIIWMMHFREDPGTLTIDHIDRNPLNNRISNLRLATTHEQNMNTRCTSPSTATRYIGLTMHSYKNSGRHPRWYGQIYIAGKYYTFGSAAVNTIDDAPPSWLVERATRLYALRDDPNITDDTLIDLIKGLKRPSGVK